MGPKERDEVLAGVRRALHASRTPMEAGAILRALGCALDTLPGARRRGPVPRAARTAIKAALAQLPPSEAEAMLAELDRSLVAVGVTGLAPAPKPPSAPAAAGKSAKRRARHGRRRWDESFVSSFFGQDVPWSTDD